jgi:hypothetical protein
MMILPFRRKKGTALFLSLSGVSLHQIFKSTQETARNHKKPQKKHKKAKETIRNHKKPQETIRNHKKP